MAPDGYSAALERLHRSLPALIVYFNLKDSGRLKVWKVQNEDHYWTEVEGVQNSRMFHKSLTALVDYLNDKINPTITKKSLLEGLKIMF